MTTATKRPKGKTKPTDPRDAAQQAAEALADASRSDSAADSAAMAEGRAAYVRGLLRGDPSLIAEAAEALAISPETVTEDGRLAEKLLKLQRRADARDAAAAATTRARAELKELERRCKAELTAAQRKLGKFEHTRKQGTLASGELQNLQRTRPEFFGTDGRLLSSDGGA